MGARWNSVSALLAALGMLIPSMASSHALAPALLELKEDAAGRVEILWKSSSIAAPGTHIEPVPPPGCPRHREPSAEKRGTAIVLKWAIDCGEQGLVGRPLRIEGLDRAGIDTLVRIELSDGRQIQRVLRRSEASMIVPARSSKWQVFSDYLTIGFEHILSGADHLLLVFGLFVLCVNLRALVKTITSFTVGHSITLSVAALGFTNFPIGLFEVLIAASVLALAVELARDETHTTLMRRHPWPIALAFGLLHGMGFAGALREVGLPNGEIPMALLSFNIGIEIGQLVFVLTLAVFAGLASRLPVRLPTRITVYAMGSLAAYWVLERGLAIL